MLGDLLITFFAVARQGSVTTAARQLKLSQPTVTGRIRQLEESYGVELFHRRGSRLELSDVGVALMPHAERFAQQGSDVDFLLRNAGSLQSGNLRIGATGPYYILRSIAAFRERFPAVELSLEIGNSQQILQALFEYRIDLAVSSRLEEDPRVTRRLVASDPLVAVMHPDHALARHAQVDLAQLVGCALLLRESGSMTRHVFETALARVGLELPPHTVIGSREAIYEAIRLNLGVSVLPRGEVPGDPALRAVPLAPPAPMLHEYLYCLDARRAARLIDTFLACVPSANAPRAPFTPSRAGAPRRADSRAASPRPA
ncbi:LysR substrate-binding domain-containing protein [Burkholderia sp. FERM BP-3421]|uniref:LysR substrate-binding domain-containing protein n=1 Tax=Burkholderia sp. FERM BP-3421 TaxID=1494466 RepID=UPI00236215AB|nr:LysR substrate-binding domain-containing protein [Burkholderia sp. FERM BP-3421]WDD92113.1 LysR substrate-binding domain-containing protein [Burkholderia sp. FERM BP-3421]